MSTFAFSSHSMYHGNQLYKPVISEDYLFGSVLNNLSAFQEDPVLSLSRPKSTKPKTNTPTIPSTTLKSSSDVDKQIQLESLKNDNLKLQLEIVHAQLELAQFSSSDLANPNQDKYCPPSSITTEVPSSLQNLKGSTPLSILGQHNSADDCHIPSLQDLHSKEKDRKQPSLLPNEYLISAKVNTRKGRIREAGNSRVCGWFSWVCTRLARVRNTALFSLS